MSLRELLRLSEEEKRRRGLVHTPREIAQQPATWRDTFRVCTRAHGELGRLLSSAGLRASRGGSDRPERPVVVFAGAGTSAYAGAAVAGLFRKTWSTDTHVVPSTELLTHAHDILVRDRKYFFVSFSRSGTSPESVATVARLARERPDLYHLVITCNGEGPMAREFAGHPRVFCLVLDDAVNDRSLVMTSSFSNMVVAAQYVASLREPAAYGETLDDMSEAADGFLDRASVIAARVASADVARVCFLGSGTLHAVARESALKVLEMTSGRVPTLAESFLGVRHGPLAFVDRQTLLVAFLSSDPRSRAYELDLLEEVRHKKLAQSIVGVTQMRDPRAESLLDQALSLDVGDLPDDYRPPLDVLLGQLLGLFFALRCDVSPDEPSATGAITRVVSGVRIHA